MSDESHALRQQTDILVANKDQQLREDKTEDKRIEKKRREKEQYKKMYNEEWDFEAGDESPAEAGCWPPPASAGDFSPAFTESRPKMFMVFFCCDIIYLKSIIRVLGDNLSLYDIFIKV